MEKGVTYATKLNYTAIVSDILPVGAWFDKLRFAAYSSVGCGVNFFLALISLLLVSCLEQYDPTPHWDKFEQERRLAHRPLQTLTAKGELPSQDVGEVDIATVVATKYQQFCSNCHGAQGKGDGIAGQALTPKPRDFSDSKWQQDTDDERIYQAIAAGGEAVGLNNSMAAFGAILSPEEIKAMVAKIRKFK
ncbi:MAG: cytochrome c [Pseudomonadota bacterium]|nr:cytochrome c [Pseudomonadota bacterium]